MPTEQLEGLVTVLDLVRTGAARTRPELGRLSGLGRTVITQRVSQLIEVGLVTEGSLGPSTGGRAPRELRFCSALGRILVADLGATSIAVGIADLSGNLLADYEEAADIAAGPEVILSRVEEHLDALLATAGADAPPIWGIGIGLPGPVEFATGRPIAPPIMPGWDDYPVRDRLSSRYTASTWVDNDVNLMALAELRSGLARSVGDVIYLKVGSGIGAGLISGSRLHRGAQGAAGDIGHIEVTEDKSVVCRCGNTGCLEALAGGAALGWQATAAARDGKSQVLAQRLSGRNQLEAIDVAEAARHGDSFSVYLLTRAADLIGQTLAKLVNFYNPSLVIVGGGVVRSGDVFLAAIRQATYRRSLPLATRELRISTSSLGDRAGLTGAAFLAIDELFSHVGLAHWLTHGSPVGSRDLAFSSTPP